MPSRLPRLILCLVPAVLCGADWTRNDMLGQDQKGRTVYRGIPVPEKFRNPWPERYEDDFQARARRIINAQQEISARGNTYFENEKRTYGYLMAHVLGNNPEQALKVLQQQDHQHEQWHRETAGIDYYAAFTLKHQMRKYFYFGDLLEPDYRQQMFEGAKSWTQKDPLRRPHYAYEGPKPGWGPDAKNSWVDVRSTENLFLMRITSVYLMAEETGNRSTADKYKQLILDYTATLYRVGMGEWDSENYHGHSLAPLLNLYDFAQNDDVKLAAKACLDFMFAIGAVKYYRGGFNGPTKRDYNHPQPFGGSAPAMLWVSFGDAPRDNDHWESDEVHLITSSYRPPEAVVRLARKEFDKPVTLLASKPHYSATTSLDRESPPAYLETQHIGQSFLLGSLAGGTRPGKEDVNGFKILVYDKQQGAVALQCVPGPDPNYPGSPQYQEGKVAADNRVAQDKNLAIWLVQDGTAPWRWVIPDSVDVLSEGDVTFFKGDRTWIAVQGLGTTPFQIDSKLTKSVSEGKKARFPAHKVLAARGTGKHYCGIAVLVGEQESYGRFEEFRQSALNSEIDQSELEQGIARYKTDTGQWLGFHWNEDPQDLGVWKNGTRHDWNRHKSFLYRSEQDALSPIHAAWGEGVLYVECGDSAFGCHVSKDGHVRFSNGEPAQVKQSLNR